MYMYLSNRANKNRECYPSVRTIAEDLHVQKNAWIEGDITAKQFSVLQGAHLESKIVMLQHLAEEETESDQETEEVFHTEAEEEEESN